MKLNNRLSTIADMVSDRYDHVWDCCCDHGFLGHALLSGLSAKVHFVDVVEPLIDQLQIQLEKQFPRSENWQVHCTDLRKIILPASGPKHLLIIAGVGGDLIIEFVQKILCNNPNANIEFMLCPVRHNFKVRQALIDQGLGLFNEKLVFDKGLFYEVIHVGREAKQSIETMGSLMWDLSQQPHRDYLEQNIAHYQRAVRSKPEEFSKILYAYQKLKSGIVCID